MPRTRRRAVDGDAVDGGPRDVGGHRRTVTSGWRHAIARSDEGDQEGRDQYRGSFHCRLPPQIPDAKIDGLAIEVRPIMFERAAEF